MAQFASSNFNGTEGDDLSTFDANWIKNGTITGGIEIASSRARSSTVTTPAYYYNATPASADYSVTVEVYVPSGGANSARTGPVARMAASPNTMYVARYDSANNRVELSKFVAGTSTSLGTSSRSVSVGVSYPLTIDVSGSSINVTWNNEGSPLLSVTDTSITAAGFPGIRWFSGVTPTDTAGLQLDNFSADEAGGGAVTHTATGALTGPSSTVAGTASSATTRTASGAIIGPGSTVAGSASRIDGGTAHTATGVLVGAGSTVAGAASRTRVFSSAGVLAGAGAMVSGAAQHLALHASSGVLVGGGSALVGSASRVGAAVTHTASGVLVGPGSLLNGAGQVGDVLIDTHDGFWAKEWARIRAREKRKYQEEIQERVEEIQDEIAEVEQQIVEVKQAPKPKKSTPARDFYAEQARIVEHLIARRNQLIDEEDEELLLLL